MSMYFILFFVFLSVTLLILAAYKYYAIDNNKDKAINARLHALEDKDNADEAIQILREKRGLKYFSQHKEFYEINKFLIQTGIIFDFSFKVKILLFFLLSIVIAFIALGASWYSPIFGFIGASMVFIILINRLRNNRISKFEAQLPDALDIIVRSLRAGHPTQTAIALASRECHDPIGTEFGLASDEIRHGLDISAALRNMSDRVGMADLIYVEAAIAVQSTSGGSLSEVVSRLSTIIRERFKLRQKVAALTAEGRISGLVLTALPVAIGAVVAFTTPSYYGEAIHDSLFYKAMLLSGGLLTVGHLHIQQLLKFKY